MENETACRISTAPDPQRSGCWDALGILTAIIPAKPHSTHVLTFRFGDQLSLWASVLMSLVVAIFTVWLMFRLFRLVLPCLGKLVAWGVLVPPAQERLDREAISSLGRSGTVGPTDG